MSSVSGDTPKANQVTATTTAGNLGNQVCTAVVLQCDPGAANNVLVGDSANQYFALKPSQALTLPCSNTNQVYVKTASGTSVVNFISVY